MATSLRQVVGLQDPPRNTREERGRGRGGGGEGKERIERRERIGTTGDCYVTRNRLLEQL